MAIVRVPCKSCKKDIPNNIRFCGFCGFDQKSTPISIPKVSGWEINHFDLGKGKHRFNITTLDQNQQGIACTIIITFGDKTPEEVHTDVDGYYTCVKKVTVKKARIHFRIKGSNFDQGRTLNGIKRSAPDLKIWIQFLAWTQSCIIWIKNVFKGATP